MHQKAPHRQKEYPMKPAVVAFTAAAILILIGSTVPAILLALGGLAVQRHDQTVVHGSPIPAANGPLISGNRVS